MQKIRKHREVNGLPVSHSYEGTETELDPVIVTNSHVSPRSSGPSHKLSWEHPSCLCLTNLSFRAL